jgi:hypothetical protein
MLGSTRWHCSGQRVASFSPPKFPFEECRGF